MKKWVKRLGIALLVLAGLLVGSYVLRAPILRMAANFWIVNQSVSPADAIVVLGGGLETRPFAAAKLYRAGVAPRILLMNVKSSPTTTLGITPTEAELTRRVLLAEGAAETNLVEIGHEVVNSYDESLAVRDWVRQTGASRIIIVTDMFHTRRVRWLYGHELAGMNVTVSVIAAPGRDYTASDWWQHEAGLVAFQNELLKFAYYRVKY